MKRVRAAVSAFVVGGLGLTACSVRSDGPTGAPDASAAVRSDGRAAIAEAPEAHARLAELRARFLVRRAAAPGPSHGAPPGSDVVGDPAIARGVATSFARIDDAHVRAALADDSARGVRHAATVTLPERASHAVELEDATSHLAVRFALRGASDASIEVADGLALYRGALAGSDVVHRVHAEGTEDYVVFERRPADEAIAYDLDVSRVAGLRLVSNVLELLDASGTPRLRVAPPYVVDAKGAVHEASIAVEGCAYDHDPRAPWGRTIVSPGASRCAVRIRWGTVAYPAVVDPAWTATGSMASARAALTATVLGSGQVLVAGGYQNGGASESSAELFDPTTGTWGATGSMKDARSGHVATLLGSGKVLVASGFGVDFGIANELATAELYDPSSGTWTSVGSMTGVRALASIALLGSGKALVVGGEAAAVSLATAEIFDPSSATWTSAASMQTARESPTATSLTSGKVLVTGGWDEGTHAAIGSAEMFDPSGGAFSPVAPMSAAREGHTATRLPSGNVLVAGGANSLFTTVCEVFDVAKGTWSAVGDLTQFRKDFTATLLSSGQVLVASGATSFNSNTATSEVFDEASSTWKAAGNLGTARHWHAAALLPSGAVLVAGGLTSVTTATSSAELWSLLPVGGSCVTDGDCSSGFCADAVCCTSACTATCMACSAAKKGTGSDGTCGPIATGTDPDDECVDQGAATCGTNGTCDGAGACAFYAAGSSCGTASCVGETLTTPSCSGTGSCISTGTSCAPYACDGATGCRTSCASASDCAQDAYCDATGHCKASKPPGAACAAGAECKSGFCADGVCCDSACNGQCQACDVAPNVGKCSTIAGAPHTGRPACAGAGTSCAGTCDGVNAAACSYPGSTTSCGTSCVDGSASSDVCDGKGACKKGSPTPCAGGYACDGTTACKTSCATDGDCVAGYVCATGKCTPKGGSKCSDDGLSSVAPGGTVSCGAFRCDPSSGTCRQTCATVDDCATPNDCDPTTHQCTPPAASAPESSDTGGCGCRTAGGRGASRTASGALLLALVVATRRRTRRRAARP